MAAAGISCSKMKRRLLKSAEQAHQVTDEAEKSASLCVATAFLTRLNKIVDISIEMNGKEKNLNGLFINTQREKVWVIITGMTSRHSVNS